MTKEMKLNLIGSITESICEAWKDGYYSDFEMNSDSINFAEIRDWCGLEYIDPEDSNYTPEDRWIDNQITTIYNHIKNSIK